MNIRILILCLCIVFAYSEEQKLFNTWDYVFNGTCPEGHGLCLPYDNISFSYIWEGYTEERIISEANEWLKSQPNFNKKIHVDKSRAWYGKNLGIFVDEKVLENETIATFLHNETYSSDLDLSHFKNTSYYERDMAILKRLNLSGSDDSILNQAFILLYNFYHFEDSPNKPDLRLFPSKPLYPLIQLTNFEIALLDKDESNKFIVELRKYYFQLFFKFRDHVINATLETSEFQSFFNRSEVNFNDWVYVVSMVYAYSVYDVQQRKDGLNEAMSFIPPILKLAVQNKETEKDTNRVHSWRSNIFGDNDTREFTFEATTKLLKSDEILINPENNQYHIWLNMGFLIKRPDGCISTNLVPKEVEESFNIPSYACIKATDEFLINKVYLTGNILNMEEKDLKHCMKRLEKQKDMTEGRKMEILFNECKHPKWKTVNLFKGLIQELDLRIEVYEANYKMAENLGARRIRDGESVELSLQIRDYLKERLDLCTAIMGYVKEMKKVNKKLNHLTDADRKKVKEILEEKLEKEEEARIEKEIREEL